MSQKPATLNPKPPAERVVRDIRRAARRHDSAEDKIRIVLEGLRGEDCQSARKSDPSSASNRDPG